MWITLNFLVSQNETSLKQNVDMLVNFLYDTVMWMLESIFLETTLFFVNVWNSLPATVDLRCMFFQRERAVESEGRADTGPRREAAGDHGAPPEDL